MNLDLPEVDLGTEAGVSNISELHRLLCEIITSKPDGARIDGSKLRSIDGAVLQLLFAFVRDMENAGNMVFWMGVSPALETAAKTMGLYALLDLESADGDGI